MLRFATCVHTVRYLLEICRALIRYMKMPCISRHPLMSKRVTQKHSKERLQQEKLLYKLPFLKARAGLTYLRHPKLKAIVCLPIPLPPLADPNVLKGDLCVNCCPHGLLSINTNPCLQVKESRTKSLYVPNRHASPLSAVKLHQHHTFSQGCSQNPPTEYLMWEKGFPPDLCPDYRVLLPLSRFL